MSLPLPLIGVVLEGNTENKEIFQRVTDAIVKALEEGAGSYWMPWRTSGGFSYSPINVVSNRPNRGINILVLWAAAQEKGYNSGTWATYKQWKELGAQVKKGVKSTSVVFRKYFEGEEEATTGSVEKKSRHIPMARDYWVLNAEQVDLPFVWALGQLLESQLLIGGATVVLGLT